MKKITQINLTVSCIAALIEAVLVYYFATKTGDLIGSGDDLRYYLTIFVVTGGYYLMYIIFFWGYGLARGKLKNSVAKNLLINSLVVVILLIGHAFFALIIAGGMAF